MKRQAVNLFIKHTKYDVSQIKSIAQIHNGFTNISYKVTTTDGCMYQIRIGNNHVVERNNENTILKTIKDKTYLYFNTKTGDAIKKWIIGVNPTYKQVCSSMFLKAFAKSLITLHNINTKTHKILKHDYLDCFKRSKLPSRHRDKYLSLIKQYQNIPMVLSHNDLSADNLIYTPNHQVIFIDYEWSRLNNAYWDVANFIREVGLPLNKIKELYSYLKLEDIKTLLNFVYLSTNYAYQWTFNMPMNPKIKKYRSIVLKKMEHYFNWVN